MKLRTKILFGAIFYLALVGLGGFALYQTSKQMGQEVGRIEFTKNIFGQVTSRRGLLIEYLMNPNERIRTQWDTTISTFDALLQLSPSNDHKYSALVAEINQSRKVSDTLFGQLTEEEDPEIRASLVSRMLIASQTVISQSKQLIDLSLQDIAAAQKLLFLIFTIFIGGLLTGIVLLLFFLNKNIIKPILRLTTWTDGLARAQFTVIPATDIKTRDEVGTLASSFEKMATRLKESYEGLERKVKERTAELAGAKAKDEAILLSLGDGLIATDKDGKIVLVNSVFEKLLGWSEREVQGKKLLEFLPLLDESGKNVPEKKRIFTNAIRKKSTTTTTTTTLQYKRKDGSLFPVATTVSPIVLEGNVVGIVEVFRDISKEKEIDKAKTEFVSLASHQLRTPLSTVNWYAEMLLAGDAGKVNNEQKKYLDEIYRGNQRMVKLVSALLNVSRIELGTFAVDPEPTDMVKLVHSVLEEQKPQLGLKKLELKTKFASNIPTMQVDSKLLWMVFQNLISNAVKYTPEGGAVSLSMSLKKAGEKCDEEELKKDSLCATVADTGWGIPEAQQIHIFEKLFRADNVKEQDVEGTGLGLYIVKSIIKQSGGNIWFKSPYFSQTQKGKKENKGTIFYVTLPIEGMKKKEGSKPLE